MTNCWASCLGDCGTIQSREHIVSKSLFVSPNIAVHGFPWCKDSPKTIGLGSATAKILCKSHNERLSPLDSVASAAFEALRQQTKLANERGCFPISTRFSVKRFHINARTLERWFLKTLLNFSYQGNYYIGPSGLQPGIAPLDLVKICFEMADFTKEAGMYVAAHDGMSLNFSDVVEFFPLIKDDQQILGGFFSFRGVRFFLSLMPNRLSVPLSSISNIDDEWRKANLLRPFNKITAKHGKSVSHVVHFDW